MVRVRIAAYVSLNGGLHVEKLELRYLYFSLQFKV